MTEPPPRVPSVPEPSSARFDLRCWGEFRLFDRLHGAECSPHRRKARAVVTYLASHAGAAINRERLCALLWSERGDQQARASLRQTLLELRPYTMGASRLLVIDRDLVRLNSPVLTSDIGRIEALAHAVDLDALSRALPGKDDQLYGGLDGLDPAFDEWLALERRAQLDRLLALGAAAAAQGWEYGAYQAVSHLTAELQAFDETNEAVAQIGMRADHACRDDSAVRRRYGRLCKALKQDLGVNPSQSMEALFGELTGLERPSAAGSETAPLARMSHGTPPRSIFPSIAVLPFISRSGAQADEAFAHGMVDDLAATLSGIPRVKVVASSVTARYREGPRSLRHIGRSLGVRYLLEGNVRRAGEDLRVTAQLIETESESIQWMQKFDRPLTNFPALQEELVAEIAAHVGVQLGRAEMAHALKKPGNFSAWESVMRAHAYYTHATRSGWQAAVAEAKRAVDIDPDDGFAYALLASLQVRLLHDAGGDDPERVQEITDNIRRARTLDPNSPSVLSATAGALIGLGNLQDALLLAERAVALSPHSDGAHFVLGAVLVRAGRSDDALAELDTAEHLAPNGILTVRCSIWRSVAHLQAGRLDQALEAADRSLRVLPGPESLIQSSVCLAKAGHWDRARAALRHLRNADPEMSCAPLESLIRYFHGGSNDVDEYVAIARKMWDETQPNSP
jgi:TolB-like protein/DNA-binding SARP family transcriptional activator/Flp pilus assembly protein TadD